MESVLHIESIMARIVDMSDSAWTAQACRAMRAASQARDGLGLAWLDAQAGPGAAGPAPGAGHGHGHGHATHETPDRVLARVWSFAGALERHWASRGRRAEALQRACAFPADRESAWRLVTGRPRPAADAAADAAISDLVIELLEQLDGGWKAPPPFGAPMPATEAGGNRLSDGELKAALACAIDCGNAAAAGMVLSWRRFRHRPATPALDEWADPGAEGMSTLLRRAVAGGSTAVVKTLLRDMLVAVLLPPSNGVIMAAAAGIAAMGADADAGAGEAGAGEADAGEADADEADADEADEAEYEAFEDERRAVVQEAIADAVGETLDAAGRQFALEVCAPAAVEVLDAGQLDSWIPLDALSAPLDVLDGYVLDEVSLDDDEPEEPRARRAAVLVDSCTLAIALAALENGGGGGAAAAGAPLLGGIAEWLRAEVTTAAFRLCTTRAAIKSLECPRADFFGRMRAAGLTEVDAYLLVNALAARSSTPSLREVVRAAVAAGSPELRATAVLPLVQLGVLRAALAGDVERIELLLAYLAHADAAEAAGLAIRVAARLAADASHASDAVLMKTR